MDILHIIEKVLRLKKLINNIINYFVIIIMPSNQDWTPVILTKNKPKVQPRNMVSRDTLPKITTSSSVKLNENDEVTNIKYVSKDISQLIINGRINKKYTRQQLGGLVNVKESVIADIENGKAIYDGNLIAKIKKILN